MILYHRTTLHAAEAILKGGFRDATDYYMTEREWSGVWLSNRPLDANEGAKGNVLLRVTIQVTEEELTYYEWVEEGKMHREWLLPAKMLNSKGIVEVVKDEDEF